jgi:hypothetical protein
MNKKTITVITICFSAVFVVLILNGSASPGFDQDHDMCHTVPGGYSIGHTLNTSNSFGPSVNVIFNVTATGSSLFVQAPSAAKDNEDFNILPTTTRITDGSVNDQNPNPDEITVIFNITTPEQSEFYYILIIAGDDSVPGGSPPPFDYVEIGFSIGGVAPPGIDWLSNIFNHLGLYLGLPALLFVTLGALLVLINENKFVKVHGILAGSSWILTTINMATAIIRIPITSWFGVWPLIVHIPHIILGTVGLVSGFFSMLFGIAAERKPALITGYITLVSWWTAFVLGYFLNSNLFLL